MTKIVLVLGILLASTKIFASGMGWSMYPLMLDQKILSTEFVGDFSSGGGAGFQGRYTQRVGTNTIFDGGIGYASGERAGRIFLGMDYELFPDYMNQPRISLKTLLQNSKEYEERVTRLFIAPIVSKGFYFWGNEGIPYISVPVGVGLNNTSKTYAGFAHLSFGLVGKMPVERYNDILVKLEGQWNLTKSYSGMFLGVSFPIN
jgi:hypothetical protein